MKKEQNRHSLHLIRQNVPQFILLVIFSVLLGVSVIAVSVLMKMFLDIATNACTMPLTTCLIIAVGVLLVLDSLGINSGIEVLGMHMEKLMVYCAMVFAVVLELIQMRYSSNLAKWKEERRKE